MKPLLTSTRRQLLNFMFTLVRAYLALSLSVRAEENFTLPSAFIGL